MNRSGSSSPPESPIFFLHIPKTAGSTLYRIIENHYPFAQIYTFWQTGTLDDFKRLNKTQRNHLQVVRGHVGCGVDDYLPSGSRYFTFLRHPIERVISYYTFIRRSPKHYCFKQITQNNLDLEAFIRSKSDTLADNGQVRLLANLETGHEIPFGKLTDKHLQQAKNNLQTRIEIIGLTEHFDETLFLLSRAFNWQNFYYARQNVSANHNKSHNLPKSTNDILVATNQLDLALYEFATQLFEQQIENLGDRFPQQLAAFQTKNQQKQRWINLLWETRKFPINTYLRNQFKRLRP